MGAKSLGPRMFSQFKHFVIYKRMFLVNWLTLILCYWTRVLFRRKLADFAYSTLLRPRLYLPYLHGESTRVLSNNSLWSFGLTPPPCNTEIIWERPAHPRVRNLCTTPIFHICTASPPARCLIIACEAAARYRVVATLLEVKKTFPPSVVQSTAGCRPFLNFLVIWQLQTLKSVLMVLFFPQIMNVLAVYFPSFQN